MMHMKTRSPDVTLAKLDTVTSEAGEILGIVTSLQKAGEILEIYNISSKAKYQIVNGNMFVYTCNVLKRL